MCPGTTLTTEAGTDVRVLFDCSSEFETKTVLVHASITGVVISPSEFEAALRLIDECMGQDYPGRAYVVDVVATLRITHRVAAASEASKPSVTTAVTADAPAAAAAAAAASK